MYDFHLRPGRLCISAYHMQVSNKSCAALFPASSVLSNLLALHSMFHPSPGGEVGRLSVLNPFVALWWKR